METLLNRVERATAPGSAGWLRRMLKIKRLHISTEHYITRRYTLATSQVLPMAPWFAQVHRDTDAIR